MRTVFFGTPEIAVPTLRAVAWAHEVTAVVCQPDRPKGRGRRLEPPPVKEAALDLGLPVHQPAKLNDGTFQAWLEEHAPDVCVIAAYGRIIKEPLLDVPPHGWVNMHPSLLPRWRGPAPIFAALRAGDSETGVTIMQLTPAMDAGDIILQERTTIGEDETAGGLSDRLAESGAQRMLEALTRLEAGTAAFTPQHDAGATYSRMVQKEDGRIRWDTPARVLHNLVRACNPWPLAQTRYHNQVYRIYRTKLTGRRATAPPGNLALVEREDLLVAAADEEIAILELQAPGKRAMATGDFLRGHPMEVGDFFENFTLSPEETPGA